MPWPWLSDDDKQAVIREATVFAVGMAFMVLIFEVLGNLIRIEYAFTMAVALIVSFSYGHDEQAYTGRNVTQREKLARLATIVSILLCCILVSAILSRGVPLVPYPSVRRVTRVVDNIFTYGLVFTLYRSMLLFVAVVLSSLL